MLFYNIGSLVKIWFWIWILIYLYNNVNVYQDTTIALSFGFLGVFLVTWWISFYVFFIFQKFFSKKLSITVASESYKLSLLFWLFILVNIALIILEKWTKIVWIWIFILFIILQLITVWENDKEIDKETWQDTY